MPKLTKDSETALESIKLMQQTYFMQLGHNKPSKAARKRMRRNIKDLKRAQKLVEGSSTKTWLY